MDDQMQFISAVTTATHAELALRDLIVQVSETAQIWDIDLMVAFFSPHFAPTAAYIANGLRDVCSPRVFLGCTAESVVGRDEEIEGAPAITLLAAHLPGVALTPFVLNPQEWDDLAGHITPVLQELMDSQQPSRLFLLLGDPFSTPMSQVLEVFNAAFPDVPVMGGMASGGAERGANVLILNERTLAAGLVGVAMAGALEVDVLVSQGCRPIGRPLTITEARRNIILRLEDAPPMAIVEKLVADLSPQDRALLRNGLFIGRAIDADRERLGRGEFLVRGVLGVDPESGAIAVGDYVQPGETVQFHLRDARTANEDLEMVLSPQVLYEPPAGALLFTCNGRGTRLYDHANGDVATIQRFLGDVALAGFFCAGEIGPIGGVNFLHGQTASLVLFRPG